MMGRRYGSASFAGLVDRLSGWDGVAMVGARLGSSCGSASFRDRWARYCGWGVVARVWTRRLGRMYAPASSVGRGVRSD